MINKIYFKLKSFFYKKKKLNDINFDKFLVFSNTALGDTILSTPAIKSLKKSFPNSKIIAVLNPKYVDLFDDFEYIDEIIKYDGKDKTFFKTLKQIKKYNPNMALIFHSNIPQDVKLCVSANIPYILKHHTTSKLKKYLSFNFDKKNQHVIEDRLELVKFIGGKKIDKIMEIGKLNDKKLKEKYKKYNDYIGFQIGAADIFKMWPIENFIELAKRLNKKIVITGIKSEYELAQKIVKECQNVENLCGKLSIKELPYLINNLKVLVTNDTGTMHLAVALKTPTISLFSPTNASLIGPYQDLKIHKVIQKDGKFITKLPKKKRDDSAMKLIKVDEVIKAYKELNENLSL